MHKNITISDSNWKDLKDAAERMNTTACAVAARLIENGVANDLEDLVEEYELDHEDDEDEDDEEDD